MTTSCPRLCETPSCCLAETEELRCLSTSTEGLLRTIYRTGCDEQERQCQQPQSRSTDVTYDHVNKRLVKGDEVVDIPRGVVIDAIVSAFQVEPTKVYLKVDPRLNGEDYKKAWYFAGHLHYFFGGVEVELSFDE